mgnify:CR=1 FL=1
MNDDNTKVVDEKVAEEEKEKQEIILINEETIQSKMYIVRGQKVMLDVDLAEIYGYETKNFNRQVKNNQLKFEGDDFMFRLTGTSVALIFMFCSLSILLAADFHVLFIRVEQLLN